jgi:4'-phosphopantetheinyl transferase EntD
VAAVARQTDLLSLGIDIEQIVSSGTANDIAAVCMNWRESQCLYPLVKCFFDFTDAEIILFDSANRRIHIKLLRDLRPGWHLCLERQPCLHRVRPERLPLRRFKCRTAQHPRAQAATGCCATY